MRRASLLVAAALGVLPAGCGEDEREADPPPPRRGLIVPQQSIDTLVLGMSGDEVRRLYGRPDEVKRLAESEAGTPIHDWLYRDKGMTAEFRQTGAAKFELKGLFTTSAAQRTEDGAGVGSSEEEVTRAVDDLDCGPGDPGERWCTLDGDVIGTPQTIFVMRTGKVVEVRVLETFP